VILESIGTMRKMLTLKSLVAKSMFVRIGPNCNSNYLILLYEKCILDCDDMLSNRKEIKKANGTRIFIISKCAYCGKEMRIFVNNNIIEASCRDCNIWKRY
jgi:hypothetical protein